MRETLRPQFSVVWECEQKTDFLPRLLPGYFRRIEVYDQTPGGPHRTWAMRDAR